MKRVIYAGIAAILMLLARWALGGGEALKAGAEFFDRKARGE